MDPPISWEERSDLFHIAVTTKEKVSIEDLLDSIERQRPQPFVFVNPTDSKLETQNTARLETNKREQKKNRRQRNGIDQNRDKWFQRNEFQ